MSSDTIQLGKLGEKIAVDWLKDQGYKIVEKNYHKQWGEIDIVTIKDNYFYFIEVKSVQRRLDTNGKVKDNEKFRPSSNVHDAKVKRLHRAVQTWLAENNHNSAGWQIDLVTVRIDLESKKASVNRIDCISL